MDSQSSGGKQERSVTGQVCSIARDVTLNHKMHRQLQNLLKQVHMANEHKLNLHILSRQQSLCFCRQLFYL